MLKKSSLIDHATCLAELFAMIPHIVAVGLTGSLAREEDRAKANDIDLVIFHDGMALEDQIFVVALEDSLAWSRYGVPPRGYIVDGITNLRRICPDASYYAILRYLEHNLACKLDVICANVGVLADCSLLEKFSKITRDPDLGRRIFCETPLLLFVPLDGEFNRRNPIRHRDGICCKPKISWSAAKQERVLSPSEGH